MSVGLNVWSQTASANSTSDTNINWAEGMAPSQVNDSARAMMASMAKWRDDNNGTIVTSGSTTAYTVVTSQVEAALTAGYEVQFQMHATSDTSATLAVDSLAAKPLQVFAGSNLAGGELTIGNIYRATYSTSGTGQWIVRDSGNQTNNIAANAVTYPKMQQIVNANRILGSITGSSAATVSEIALGAGLTLTSGTTTISVTFSPPVTSVFTTTAAATWQSTTNSLGFFPLYVRVRMVGGGGGGGAKITNSGSSGTDTSFSNWTATGATGGAIAGPPGTGGSGGSGGTNGTGTLITRVSGGNGTWGVSADTNSNWAGGNGGASFFGGAGVGTISTGLPAQANTGSGGGGGSVNNGGQATAGGGGAGEFVEFFVTSPATSYNYTVGAGGAGGAAGTFAGGNGAAGRIEVISYWQ